MACATDAGNFSAAIAALPTDSLTASAAAGEAFCSAEKPWLATMLLVYAAAVRLPMMATPSAPPISRVVSFIAEPTPAFSRGSDPMIESVAGAMARPMPTPMITSTAPISG